FAWGWALDLGDAKIAAPPNVASIDQKVEGDSTFIAIELIGDVDVHSFREEKNYNIDIAFQRTDRPKTVAAAVAEASRSAATSAKPTPAQSDEITPPTSETIVRQMKMDKKGEVEAPKSQVPASEPDAVGQQHVSAEPAPPTPEAAKEMPAAEAPKVELAKTEAAKTEPAKS